jgi:hypothetical protein
MVLAIILIALAATLFVAYCMRLARITRSRPEPPGKPAFICGTPALRRTLRNGGRVVTLREGDIVEIRTRDGRETLTLAEYNARGIGPRDEPD